MTALGYDFDWVAAGSWLQGVAGLLSAGAIVYAAKVGATTFEEWLKQRQTERKIASGERILSLVYKVKRAFPTIRSPASFGFEIRRAEEKLQASYEGFDDLPSGKRSRVVQGQIFLDRLSDQATLWNELFECLPLARAFFGQDLEESLEGIWKARGYVHVAAQMYGGLDVERSEDLNSRFECDFWEGIAEAFQLSDRVGDQIKQSVAQAERMILPVISGNHLPLTRGN